MRVLIVGQNTKVAKLFSYFCDDIYMVVDTTINHYRAYKESALYKLLETSTDLSTSLSVVKRSFEIYNWVRNYSIDVVFTNEKISMVAAKLATLMMRRKVKLLSTSHNSYAWMNSSKVKMFARLVNLCTDGYMALATFVADALLSFGFPEKKLLTLHNVIEPGLFEKKEIYDFKTNDIRIVYTSTVYRGKGQHVLLNALERLFSKQYGIQVDFIGDIIDKEYKVELDNFVREHNLTDQVQFLGRVNNDILQQTLFTYDIYVCPSLMEMSPYNVLEAKSAALPIVATRVGGIPDLIINNVNGLLVDAEDVDSMVAAIERLISNQGLRETLGAAAALDMTDDMICNHAGKLKKFICNL